MTDADFIAVLLLGLLALAILGLFAGLGRSVMKK
jgi:hypothetical protein